MAAVECEILDPGLLGRCEWDAEQARRDCEVLAWIGRFRFVTAQAVADRFDVSWQQANARVRRLERLGLIGREREHVSQPHALFLTGKGHELLGRPRRRPPRAQVQREHEAAIVWLVTQLERAEPSTRVLTERECRRLEHDGQGSYSVHLGATGGSQRRWPDLVVEQGDARRAIEIEFAPKGTDRLRRIVEAYRNSAYSHALFLVKSVALGRRIRRVTERLPPPPDWIGWAVADIQIAAWPALPEVDRRHLDEALARDT
ncbi:MAG TPA: helix-turn-helix domain-containing protein [Solirubrobacteraceae bacterium]